MNFDLETGSISVNSKETATNGEPLYDWNLDTNTGLIMETITTPDASKTRETER